MIVSGAGHCDVPKTLEGGARCRPAQPRILQCVLLLTLTVGWLLSIRRSSVELAPEVRASATRRGAAGEMAPVLANATAPAVVG